MPEKAGKSSKSKGLQLGRAVEWPTSPDAAQIDRVPNPQKDTNYVVRFTPPEFTPPSPVTGQPQVPHLAVARLAGDGAVDIETRKRPAARSPPPRSSHRIRRSSRFSTRRISAAGHT